MKTGVNDDDWLLIGNLPPFDLFLKENLRCKLTPAQVPVPVLVPYGKTEFQYLEFVPYGTALKPFSRPIFDL